MDDISGQFMTLHNEELRDLYTHDIVGYCSDSEI